MDSTAAPAARSAGGAAESRGVQEAPICLSDLPCEILTCIAAYTGEPWGLGSTCGWLRAVCLSLNSQGSPYDLKKQKSRAWKLTTARTLEEIEERAQPDSSRTVNRAFLAFTVPALDRMFTAESSGDSRGAEPPVGAASNDAESPPVPIVRARIERVALRFVVVDESLIYDVARLISAGTLARLMLWFGNGANEWVTEHILAAGKWQDLPPGLALALWYARSCPLPSKITTEMRALIKRVDVEAAGNLGYHAGSGASEELKWARASIAIFTTSSARDSSVCAYMRRDWGNPDWKRCSLSLPLSALFKRYVRSDPNSPHENGMSTRALTFEEFDGNLHIAPELLGRVCVAIPNKYGGNIIS